MYADGLGQAQPAYMQSHLIQGGSTEGFLALFTSSLFLPLATDCSHALQEMVCLEPAVAGSGPVTLEPGKTWKAKQTLSLRHF